MINFRPFARITIHGNIKPVGAFSPTYYSRFTFGDDGVGNHAQMIRNRDELRRAIGEFNAVHPINIDQYDPDQLRASIVFADADGNFPVGADIEMGHGSSAKAEGSQDRRGESNPGEGCTE